MLDPNSLNHKIQSTLVTICMCLGVVLLSAWVWILLINPEVLADDECCGHCPPIAAHGVEFGELSGAGSVR